MRYIGISLIVTMITSCSISKYVKQHKTPDINNGAIPINIPLSGNGHQSSDTTPNLMATNNVAIILGTIVFCICFLPLILSYTNVAYNWVKYNILKTKEK